MIGPADSPEGSADVRTAEQRRLHLVSANVAGILGDGAVPAPRRPRGRRVLDIKSIRAGLFDTIILNQIAARPYFLLVLTPGTLERCENPADWIRREIEHAVSTSRMIVPVHTPNFDFGDLVRFLPKGLGETVRRFNGLELPQRYFETAVQELVDEFLLPIRAAQVAVSPDEQTVVDRMLQAAQAAPTVTPVQLSAQEYFERAVARSIDDKDGRIADLDEAIRLNPQYTDALCLRGLTRIIRLSSSRRSPTSMRRSALTPRMTTRSLQQFARAGKGWDRKGAIADVEEAIRLNPHDLRYRKLLKTLRSGSSALDLVLLPSRIVCGAYEDREIREWRSHTERPIST